MNILEEQQAGQPAMEIVVTTAAGQIVVKRDSRRTGLVISKMGAGDGFLSFRDQNQSGQGIRFTAQTPTLQFSKTNEGALVDGEWYDATAGGGTWCVVQTFLPSLGD